MSNEGKDIPEGDGVFDLFATSTLTELQDRTNFIEIISSFYTTYCKMWDCAVDVSYRRIGEAYDYWRADVDRTLSKGIAGETTTLDHFKHAAFIAFWLRRMVPINDIWWTEEGGAVQARTSSSMDALPEGTVVVGPSNEQKFFAKFGSELLALMTGFYICLIYEINAAGDEAESDEERENRIVAVAPPNRFLFEYPKLLKHKNISSHGMYMMFHSLFSETESLVMPG